MTGIPVCSSCYLTVATRAMPPTAARRLSPPRARCLHHQLVPSSAALLLGACLDVGIPSREPPAADAGVLPSPLLVATWPAHGSAGVPDELPRAWIALGPEGPSMRIQTGWRGPLGAIAHRAEQRPCTEMGVDAFHIGHREIAAPHAGLVGDEEQGEAGVREPSQGGGGAGGATT